ncbi:helix-turn-helix transcriptional regulator [Enemella evansiae]|uniref:helix-turn-helix transcriptional regulator n=1 Tax=Enemella evansiae TaxID=2016499 RepID=UPI0015C637D4|nr:helix-turn-helix domain-containing protein [Enemella evansiae]
MTAQLESRPAALLTARDVSAQIGYSVSTIYRRRSLGESLPRAVKLPGGAVRWRQADVDAWLEAQLEDDGAK